MSNIYLIVKALNSYFYLILFDLSEKNERTNKATVS